MHTKRGTSSLPKTDDKKKSPITTAPDYSHEEVEKISSRAEQGIEVAQVTIGKLHLMGHKHVKKDAEKAVNMFQLAAKQGSVEGQLWLGYCLVLGKGIEKDVKTGIELLNSAAEQKNAHAHFLLGFFHDINQPHQVFLEEKVNERCVIRVPMYVSEKFYQLGIKEQSKVIIKASKVRDEINLEYKEIAKGHYLKAALLGHEEAQNTLDDIEKESSLINKAIDLEAQCRGFKYMLPLPTMINRTRSERIAMLKSLLEKNGYASHLKEVFSLSSSRYSILKESKDTPSSTTTASSTTSSTTSSTDTPSSTTSTTTTASSTTTSSFVFRS